MQTKKQAVPSGTDALLQEVASLPSSETNRLRYQDFIMSMTDEPTPPDYLLEMDGVGILPRGGITAITGEAKQGKTQYLAALCAVLMSGRDFGCLKRRGAARHILWVDTEQAQFNFQETIGRVYKQAGIPSRADSQKHGLTLLRLRPLLPMQRAEVIADAVEALNPDVLIIDGLRDLINDFNNIDESNAAVGWLLELLDKRPELNIVTVLHTNTGTEKMRGHLGTELMNKCQDRFTCVKENGIFKVKHIARGREVLMPFTFCIGADGSLMTASIEQAKGIVDPDEAFAASVPEDGAAFYDIVKELRKLTKLSDKDARDALKQRMKAGQLVKDNETGLFHRRK